jgi:hypothetical protein
MPPKGKKRMKEKKEGKKTRRKEGILYDTINVD